MTVGRTRIAAPSGARRASSTSNHSRVPFTSTCIGLQVARGTQDDVVSSFFRRNSPPGPRPRDGGETTAKIRVVPSDTFFSE